MARQKIERIYPGCLTIKIDPQSDENNHYPLDIVRTLERKLALPAPEPVQAATHVLNDLEVGGDINIGSVNVEIGYADWQKRDQLDRRTRRVVGTIREQLSFRRIALLLHWCEAMLGGTASWFWGSLWGEGDEGLQSLTGYGLVLICCCQTDARCPHKRRAPEPRLRLRLPSQYIGPNRAAALEDLTALVAGMRGVTPKEAHMLAEYCLEDGDYEPEQVYGSLPVLLRWDRR